MTNVKFRAWDIPTKQYVRIDAIQFDHLGNGDPVTLSTHGTEWSIKRFVLEQWTGLKDKNGREIYEGDFVRVEGPSPVVGATKWDGMKYIFEHRGGYEFLTDPIPDVLEVIGNIRQNGELLK